MKKNQISRREGKIYSKQPSYRESVVANRNGKCNQKSKTETKNVVTQQFKDKGENQHEMKIELILSTDGQFITNRFEKLIKKIKKKRIKNDYQGKRYKNKNSK